MNVGLIGAGKVGTSLGKLFCENGVCVTGYFSRSPQSTAQAAAFTTTTPFRTLEDLVQASDTLFITTPDGAIAGVWADLIRLPVKGKQVCHCSGALPSAVFDGARELGVSTASVHPLLAVSDRFDSWQALGAAFFTLEGDEGLTAQLRDILTRCGAQTAVIRAQDKPRYHLAACVVSNLAVGLADWGMQLLEQCGFQPEQAQQALSPLILGNARAICEKGPQAALTGPAERDDVTTIARHMACLNGEEQRLYAMLTRRLCQLAQKKHPERPNTALTNYLEGLL